MQAVILVGGQGTRLRPLTETRPKPMMSLVDRPFVEHQIDQLKRHGVTDVVFSCGYRPDAIESYFGDGRDFGVTMRYVVDPVPLGTAGAVANAIGLLEQDEVLVLNGDILTDLDLGAVVAGHREAGARATIALTPVEDPSAYGLVRLNPDRSVREFLEKPSRDQLTPGEPFLINAGTYVLSRDVVASIPPGRACSIEREIFPVVAESGDLYGHPSEDYWRDIGTPTSYRDAHHDVLAGRVRTESPTGGHHTGEGCEIDPIARISGGACLGAGCRVGAGVRIVGAVVGAGSTIGPNARLEGCLLGSGVTVGAGAVVEGPAVIGDGAEIAAGVALDGSARINVNETVTEASAA